MHTHKYLEIKTYIISISRTCSMTIKTEIITSFSPQDYRGPETYFHQALLQWASTWVPLSLYVVSGSRCSENLKMLLMMMLSAWMSQCWRWVTYHEVESEKAELTWERADVDLHEDSASDWALSRQLNMMRKLVHSGRKKIQKSATKHKWWGQVPLSEKS